MLIAPPFGLLAHSRAVSKDLSAFADQFILSDTHEKVKNFLRKMMTYQVSFWRKRHIHYIAQCFSLLHFVANATIMEWNMDINKEYDK